MLGKKRGLGRNLQALLSDFDQTTVTQELDTTNRELQQIPINKIIPGKYQPRTEFPMEALEELANSIRTQGVIQPIIVRKNSSEQYEIIAGERRFRAAKLAGLSTLPALVRDLPDESAVAIALIENIQRADLNPIEEAYALQRLIQEFNLTHEEAANVVGKSRVTVSNLLRLLSLSDEAKKLLSVGKIEMGHARALVSLPQDQQMAVMHEILTKGLSVRQTEELIRLKALSSASESSSKDELSSFMFNRQEQLKRHFKASVLIQQNAKGRGKIVIKYKNPQEFERIFEMINENI